MPEPHGKQFRPVIACVCCDTEGPRAGRGLIMTCYMRHRRNGTLEQFDREFRIGVSRQVRRVDECACCGAEGSIHARGLISRCYYRHSLAGTLDRFPVVLEEERVKAAMRAWQRRRDDRLEDYAEMRSWGETREQAAARLGVTEQTAKQYERMLREQVSV